MSRQQRRAEERQKIKALRKICLAAGEGVGKAVAFSIALASNAFAAEPKKEETFKLPPVVVQEEGSYYVPEPSLSRMPVPLKDVPQSITIVPDKLMEEQAATTVQEALRNVPGIGLSSRRRRRPARRQSHTARIQRAQRFLHRWGARPRFLLSRCLQS